MTAFVLLSVLLVLLAVLLVAMPLLRQRGGNITREEVDAVSLTRARQLEELEQDLADGQIDDRTYELSRREIEAEASDHQADAESGLVQRTGKPISAVVFAILLPVMTILLYGQVGDWDALERDRELESMDLDQAVTALEQRLETHPEDLEAWEMLGRTRVALGQYERAVQAYRQALDLAGEDNPRVLANYAEAIALSDPERMLSEAGPLFLRVLEQLPDHPKGLWYSGLIAFEEGRYEAARDYWQALLAQQPPEGFRAVLEDRLQATREAMGVGRAQSDRDNDTHILVSLSVSDALTAELAEDDVIFLIARAANEEAAPPLAAVRLPVSALPGPFRLGDENAMLEGHQLSNYSEVEVIARVSRSGEATPQAGDLQGTAMVSVETQPEEPVEIVIDERL